MKVADIDLPRMLTIRPDQGKLLLGDDRMLIFRQAALGSLRRLVYDHLGPALARAVFTQFGHRCGTGDFASLQQRFTWDTERDAIASGPVMHMWEGIVHVEVRQLDFDRATGRFAMAGIWRNSYEAENHLHEIGRSTTPVCHSLTGYATGWATAFFGRPLLAVETACVGKGDPHCAFEIKPEAAWGPEAEPWRRALDPAQLTVLTAQQQVIERQRRELRAMTAPILQIWDNILLVSLIGELDAERAAAITAELLSRAVDTRARHVIFDLTAIDAIDGAVAEHLLRMLRALQLIGAGTVITGILPAVARAIVDSGLDLRDIAIRATLRDGLHHCMHAGDRP